MHNPLGRGLSSLLRDDAVYSGNDNVNKVNIEDISPREDQPRKNFDLLKTKELADSIVSNGMIQPIVVNKEPDGRYKIIAGERRYRACKMVGITEVPVIIKQIDSKTILEIALIENIQREELTAIEEAEAYQRLIDEYGYNQNDIAASVGKSRSHVSNLLRLNSLPQEIKDMVNNGQLTMGHARCLLGHENAIELAHKIIGNDLNVRQAEELTRKKDVVRSQSKESSNKETINEDFILLGQSLSEKFGVKVVVENSWNGGKITFHYGNLEELDSILSRLN